MNYHHKLFIAYWIPWDAVWANNDLDPRVLVKNHPSLYIFQMSHRLLLYKSSRYRTIYLLKTRICSLLNRIKSGWTLRKSSMLKSVLLLDFKFKFTRNRDWQGVFEIFLVLPKVLKRGKIFCLNEESEHTAELCQNSSDFDPAFESNHTVAIAGNVEHDRNRAFTRVLFFDK